MNGQQNEHLTDLLPSSLPAAGSAFNQNDRVCHAVEYVGLLLGNRHEIGTSCIGLQSGNIIPKITFIIQCILLSYRFGTLM